MLLAAVRLGNLFIDDEKMKEAFVSYATHFGLAFQIQNDLQDVCWTSEQTGKETGKDSELSKNTYPSLLGVEGGKEALASEFSSCKRALEEVAFTPENQQTKALLVEFFNVFRNIGVTNGKRTCGYSSRPTRIDRFQRKSKTSCHGWTDCGCSES